MKLWLDVPYAEKDFAKRDGAQWSAAASKWYAPDEKTYELMRKWWPRPSHGAPAAKEAKLRPPATPAPAAFLRPKSQDKAWLLVPYHEKQAAKLAGARWDPDARRWFAPEGSEVMDFIHWLPASEEGAGHVLPEGADPRWDISKHLFKALARGSAADAQELRRRFWEHCPGRSRWPGWELLHGAVADYLLSSKG
jgi:hypothetical protein